MNPTTQLSELIDGELTPTQIRATLTHLLDSPEEQQTLREMLQLGAISDLWQPASPLSIRVPPTPETLSPSANESSRKEGWGLVVAVMVGGLLVLSGVWLSRPPSSQTIVQLPPKAPTTQHPAHSPQIVRVTQSEQQQVAEVFAFHESVAGPLKWFASDANQIQLASAEGEENAGPPVAVQLRFLTRDAKTDQLLGSSSSEVVCRIGSPVMITIPGQHNSPHRFRLSLSPTFAEDQLQVRYGIGCREDRTSTQVASISGQTPLTIEECSLGELRVGDEVVEVRALGWSLQPQEVH